MYNRILLLIFLTATLANIIFIDCCYASSIDELKQHYEKGAAERYKCAGIKNRNVCITCGKNGYLWNTKGRTCIICECSFCNKHCDNKLSKTSDSGGVLCNDCFSGISESDTETIVEKIDVLENLIEKYEYLYSIGSKLSFRLKEDAEKLNKMKFRQNVVDATGDSIGIVSSGLGIAGGIALWAVPGGQVAGTLALSSSISGISGLAVKGSGYLTINWLDQVQSLPHRCLISTLIFLNDCINMQTAKALSKIASMFDDEITLTNDLKKFLLRKRHLANFNPQDLGKTGLCHLGNGLIKTSSEMMNKTNPNKYLASTVYEVDELEKLFGAFETAVGVIDSSDEVIAAAKILDATDEFVATTAGETVRVSSKTAGNTLKVTRQTVSSSTKIGSKVETASKATISTSQKVASGITCTASVVGLAASSYGLYSAARDLSKGSIDEVSKLLLHFAQEMEECSTPENLEKNLRYLKSRFSSYQEFSKDIN